MADSSLSPEQLTDGIYNTGSAISLNAFHIVTRLVFALAIICAIARSVMRLWTRRPLYWDDLLLAIGVASFIAATVLLEMNTYYYYLSNVLNQQPLLIAQLPLDTLPYLLNEALPQISACSAVIWTTVFCVKGSFLMISKQLISRIPWITRYFWVVVALNVVSWVLCVVGPFIECPRRGFDIVHCTGPAFDARDFGTNVAVAVLDILTDFMIISIPLIILSKSQLDTKQKLVIGPFVCMSLAMIGFALIRISKLTRTAADLDVVWLAFWQYLEGGIALIVTSITTVRTVFTARKQRSNKTVTGNIPVYSAVVQKSGHDSFGDENHLIEFKHLDSKV